MNFSGNKFLKEVIPIMKKNTRRLLSILTLGALSASLALSGGCGKEDDETYVAVIIKSQSQYWEATKQGVEDAGNEMDIRITYEAPEKEDVEAQIQYVNNAIANKADAIIIAPAEDTDELAEALKKARNNNIPVIAIDTELREETRNSCISTNSTYAGAIAGRKAYELLGGTGSIGIVTHQPTSPLAIARKAGFEEQIKEYQENAQTGEDGTESASSLNIVATESGDGDLAKTMEATKKIINDHPDVKFIFATNQTTTRGVCRAIDELGKADEVDVIGFDNFTAKDDCKSSAEYVDSGVLDGFILQNPYNMGYLGIRYARDLIDGQNIASAIDTGATLVTKDNINDSDVKLIMNPMGN